MALSGTSSFKLQRDGLIKAALRLTTAYSPGESIPTDEMDDASDSLNMILKDWNKDGLKLWLIKETTVTLVASTSSYTIGPSGVVVGDRPLRILNDDCFIREGTSDTPLTVISREEYFQLGDKSSEGVPHSLYYDPQITNGVLYVYVTPDAAAAAAKVIHIKYLKQVDDVSSATDDIEIPQEWFRALKYNLADDLALEYGLADNKPMLMNRIAGRAKQYKKEVMDWDIENTSVFFEAAERR